MPAIPAASRSPPPGAAAPASAAGEPPIDLVHLARQTDGDSALQQELLALFDKQSASLLAQSSDRSAERRRRADAAHQLKGSALAVGAGAVARAAAAVEELRARHHGEIVIDAVIPDYYARLPKPCVGGWGRRSLNVTPGGKVLPCHAAESIPGLEFWSVRDHSLADIWANSPVFNAFRGTAWMQEPCRSCARRDIDFGGCRCQAFALTGDARATDPVCHLSPRHEEVAALAALQHDVPYVYRRM